ncbi:MAG: hypothetical protein AB7F22_29585 [Reyranella sp.]|uniref:hypothetical protein n=1 Tax=Reyranella sp. TaxID=1929291 RepID=UPI003D0CCE3C
MNASVPDWLRPAAWGGVVGIVAVAIVGFGTGWVITSGSAEEMAKKEGEKAALAALTPICVAQFKKLAPALRTTQLAALKDTSSWQRGDFVEKQGWATMPGSKEPDDEVAAACATELMKLAAK